MFTHFKILHQHLFYKINTDKDTCTVLCPKIFLIIWITGQHLFILGNDLDFFLCTFQKTVLAFLEIYFRIKLLSVFSEHVDKWGKKTCERPRLLWQKQSVNIQDVNWPQTENSFWILNYKPISDWSPLGLINLRYFTSLLFYLDFMGRGGYKHCVLQFWKASSTNSSIWNKMYVDYKNKSCWLLSTYLFLYQILIIFSVQIVLRCL